MDESPHLLLVEDNPGDAQLVVEQLAAVGSPWRLTPVPTLASALETLARRPFGATLLDLLLPDSRGLDGVRRLAAEYPSLPVVVLTGLSHELLGLDAIRAGAEDYLLKGSSDGAEIDRSLRFAVERRRSLVALRRERDLIDGLLDASPALVVELTPRGVVSHFNPAAEELTGVPSSEVVGRNWFDLFATPDRHPEAHAVFTRALDGRPGGAGEAPLMARDGTSHPVAWSWSRIEPDARLVAFGIDLRARRELEERLGATSDQARLGRMVAGVAHEVRNPLFALTARLDVLAREQSSAVWRLGLEELRAPAERLAGLTDELIELSEPALGEERPVSAREQIEAALVPCQRQAEARRIAIVPSFDAACPDVSSAGRLQRVTTTLVSHALRNSPEGSVLHVSASRAHEGERSGLACLIATASVHSESVTGLEALSSDDARRLGLSVALVRQHLATHACPLEARSGSTPAFRFWLPAFAPRGS